MRSMSNVLDKVVKILKLLIPKGNIKEWGASELARRCALPVGTVHRILLELKKQDLVIQNDVTKKFRLGFLLIELGFAARENLSIIESAKPVLKDLAEQAQETAHLTIQDGCNGVLIDKIETVHQLKVVEQVGMRTPLSQGALKKAILAFLNQDEIHSLIHIIEKMHIKKGIPWNYAKVVMELESIRQNGYAISYGEVTPGTVAIASPVFDYNGRVVAAIGINGPENRFSQEELQQKIEHVKKAGAILTRNIGGTTGL